MPLTDTKLRNAKPKESNYKLYDADNLYIIITPSGGKWWRYNYSFGGKSKTLSLGTYPSVSLAEARERRAQAAKLVDADINPSEDRKDRKRKVRLDALNTFEAVANDWHALHTQNYSESHQRKIKSWLVTHLLPAIGSKPVTSITSPMILDAVTRLQNEHKLDTAHRVIQVAGQIFRYAIQKGLATYNPATDLKGAVPPPVVKHMAAMIEVEDFAKLLRSIDAYSGTLTVQCALKLAPLLFQRIGELRRMKWADLNFEKSEWRYLVTKTDTLHIVPLSRQALEIIETMRPYSGRSAFVFPGARTHERPMSDNAINAALRNMGYDTQSEITGHGFRAIAQTLGEQELGFEPKHIERQLAHSVANPLGEAYERSQFLADRKVLMQRWADYLDELKSADLN